MANLNNLIVNGESRFVGGIYGNLTGNVTGNAATATKATQDGSGNTITSTYATIAKTYDDTTNTTYRGMRGKDGANNAWVRTTTQGIIPYQGGGAGSGHCGLGTSSWYFATAYIDNIYGKLNGNCTGSSGSCTGNAASATYSTNIRVTDTDSNTWYPIVLSSGSAASTNYVARVDADSILAYPGVSPAAGTQGNCYLQLGNAKATATAGNKQGRIRIYGTGTYYAELIAGAVTANRTVTLPNATGTLATSDRRVKSKFTDIYVLDKLKKMNIQSWKFNNDKLEERDYIKANYDVNEASKPTYTKGTKDEPLHIGPCADEFNSAFGTNYNSNETLHYTDTIGVSLRAIQELAEQVDNLKREVRMYKNILGITKEQIREYKDNYAIKMLEKEQLRQKRLENNNSDDMKQQIKDAIE